ncbi:hypothetical protein BH09BAC3_BH09BAC3_14370 [soil metagenome]
MGQASNINVRGRLTQVIILIAAIVITALFSQVAKAQGSVRYDHKKYRIAIHRNSNKACFILNKKRMSRAKHDMIASSRRTSRGKAQAETDGDGLASSN